MVRYKFSKTKNKEFAAVLRQRVKEHFQEEEISVKGNFHMVIKSIVVLSIYFLPFLVILFGGITQVWLLSLLWMLMGLGKACIGTSVMHDALHGSYSQKKSINTLMHISALFIGVYPKTWKLQHNILHHTYTNIDHADDDLTPVGVLRFSPNQDHKWFFKYQHIYALFFYAGVTIAWTVYQRLREAHQIQKYGSGKAQKGVLEAYRINCIEQDFLLLPYVGASYFASTPSCLASCVYVSPHACRNGTYH